MASGFAGGRSIGGTGGCRAICCFVERLFLSWQAMVVLTIGRIWVSHGLGFVFVFFVIFGIVVVPGIVGVFGGAGVHFMFGWSACCIFCLGAGMCTWMGGFLT